MADLYLQQGVTPSVSMTQGASVASPMGITRLSQSTGTPTFYDHPNQVAGTYQDLWYRVISNGVSATTNIASRVNGSAGNLAISITSGSSGEFRDNTNSDTIADDDTYSITLAIGAGGTTFNPALSSITFTPSGDTAVVHANTCNIAGGAASTTYYFCLSGGFPSLITTEANTQQKMKHASVVSDWQMYLSTNARTSDTIYRTRKNTSNGNMIITATASTTGSFSDTSNTDTIAVDDLFNYQGTTGSGSGNVIGSCSFRVTSDDDGVIQMTSGVSSLVVNASVTAYFTAGGHLSNVATETNTRAEVACAFTASKLQIYISANTVSATSNLRLRKNGANGNQNVSITASTTGWFDDASNSDSFVATDEINYQLITGGSGTSLTVQNISMLLSSAGGNQTVSPGATTASWTVTSPTVVKNVSLTPAAVSVSWTVPATVHKLTFPVTPATASWNVPTASTTGSQNISATPVTATWNIPSTTQVTPVIVVAGNVVTAWVMPSPTVVKGVATVTPGAAVTNWVIPAITFNGGDPVGNLLTKFLFGRWKMTNQ